MSLPPPTKERLAAIAQNVRNGMSYNRACLAEGYSRGAWRYWRDQFNAGNPVYVELFEELDAENAKAEKRLAAVVSEAAEDDWQAAKWMLVCRFGWQPDKTVVVQAPTQPDAPASVADSELEESLRSNG